MHLPHFGQDLNLKTNAVGILAHVCLAVGAGRFMSLRTGRLSRGGLTSLSARLTSLPVTLAGGLECERSGEPDGGRAVPSDVPRVRTAADRTVISAAVLFWRVLCSPQVKDQLARHGLLALRSSSAPITADAERKQDPH